MATAQKIGYLRHRFSPTAVADIRSSTALEYADPKMFAELVASAEDPIITKDLRGVVKTWNPAAGRTFGYSADEMIGRSILTLIPPDLHHTETTILQKIRAGLRIENFETRRLRKNGQEFTASISISPVKNSWGTVIGASKIVRDISEKKNLEELKLRNEKLAATARMASVIAHQINNPLEALVNLLYLTQQLCSNGPDVLKYLEMAQGELRRVSHMAQQSMGYYHDSATPIEVYAQELMQFVLSIYESRLQSSNIETETKFEATRKVTVRRGEVLQVLSAAVANAIDAMPFGGRLLVTSRDLDVASVKGIEVIVRDTGVGIPEQDKIRLFEPFFTTKGISGSGTSLWIAKQFIQKHGGGISIKSTAELGNSETAVSIFLPTAPVLL